MHENEILKALKYLKQGKLIAYPTEAVYGLGCDPFNQQAVYQLLSLKQRSVNKGLILVASNWQQIIDLIKPIPPKVRQVVELSWPGPVTWVFPASEKVPPWIRGQHETIALRISSHPIIQLLCNQFEQPIVSTSANVEGQPPARDAATVITQFANKIDYLIAGELGGASRPTEIRDAITGKILRSG